MKLKAIIILAAVLMIFRSNAQCTFTSSVPYYEDFSSITAAGQLPTCWAVSNAVNCQTAISPSHAAVFYSNPPGTFYYFTNGIQLYAGVVYTVSLSYISDAFAPTNWSNLAVMIGTAQTAASQTLMTQTSSIAGFAVTAMGGTFSVNSNGIYYSAIRATATSTTPSTLLAFSNFSIGIPCSFVINQPAVGIVASTNTVCSGKTVTLTASGANTYTWVIGNTTPVITVMPSNSLTTYSVTGTNSLTGCTNTAASTVSLFPTPIVTVAATPTIACVGQSFAIVAGGATSYAWNIGATTQTITVISTFAGPTTLTVTGTTGSCSSTASVSIMAVNQPTIQVSANSFAICNGDAFPVQFSGAPSYSVNGAATSFSVAFTPTANTTYTVVGGQGCISSPVTIEATVYECTGIAPLVESNNIDVFPNPSTGMFTVEMNTTQKFEVYNMAGQRIFQSPASRTTTVDLHAFPSGIYMVRTENGACHRVIISH